MEIPIVDNQHSFVSDRVIKLQQKIIAQFTKKNAFDHTFFLLAVQFLLMF